jgi:hypothetical protein
MDPKKFILDACCGGRSFWFNKHHPNAIYQDIRRAPKGLIKERPNFNVDPDIIGDFRKMGFPNKSFKLIVWDPPHLTQGGQTGWQVKKYGLLDKKTWKSDLTQGFKECWRVLDDYGILIFKWNEVSISVRDVLNCFPELPLFGHPTAKAGKTKWFCFMKIP